MKATEEFVASGPAELWTAREGIGPPLMLCSGGPGCCDYLGEVDAMLDDLAQVLRFEQRGCGRSSAMGPYDLETCVGDLEALRMHFGFERWTIGGHSWGADLSLCYALAHPDRTRAVLYLCGHGFHDDRGWSEAYHRAQEERGEQLPDFAYPPNPEVNRIGNASFRRSIQRPTLLRELASLKVPVLLVCAERDIRPSWPAVQLAELLPDARLETIRGAEHVPWLTHADEVRSCLRSFVSALA